MPEGVKCAGGLGESKLLKYCFKFFSKAGVWQGNSLRSIFDLNQRFAHTRGW